MARTPIKTETVTYTKVVQEKVMCDRCQAEFDPDPCCYSTREFELEFTEGTSYPDSGDKTGWEVEDLCDDYVKFLKELLIDNGFTITPIERSW